ncbi:MYPU_1760 family metalloprotease [Mycoplasma zalophi]|uniref:MYPU_1760 family metalloprotease n=1 Tax=Mycoplasma zalophi TaxID=191287 RepID=UPI001C10391E|nr:hypothetical protein [Mycoplasma zalophi]MBU4691236.1 hypothetical protein [Mycoplasma zalophi]
MKFKFKKSSNESSLLKWIVLGTSISLASIAIGLGLVFTFTTTDKYNNFVASDNEFIEFNAKTNKDGTKNPNYDPTLINIRQWAYAKDKNNDYKYFLDEEGMKKLAISFQKKGGYGPEISELVRVNLNKPNIRNYHKKSAAGLFIGSYEQIYLSTNNLIYKENQKLRNLKRPWEQVENDIKIELILPTLIHEYMHHIAAIYAQSMIINNQFQDEFATDEIVDNLRIDSSLNIDKNKLKEYGKTIYNKKFLDDFKEALLFSDKYKQYKLLESAFRDNRYTSLYKEYSASELFKIANYLQTKDNKWLNEDFTFNHDIAEWIQYLNPLKSDDLNYYYSFEELIPREFLKLSYVPKKPYSQPFSTQGGYFGFDNDPNTPFISSYAEDISRVMGLFPRRYSNNMSVYREKLYGSNWVFDDPFTPTENDKITKEKLDELLNSEDLLKKVFQFFQTKTLPNPKKRQKLLYKAYLDLMGYGLPISQISSDNTFLELISEKGFWPNSLAVEQAAKNTYSKLNFEGYINTKNAANNGIIRKTFLENNHLIVNDGTNQHIIDIVINKGNLKTKSDWKNSEQQGGQDLGPEFVGLDNNYFSYFTKKAINVKNINLNKNLEISFWEDKNQDNIIQNNEIMQINKQLAYNRYKSIKRRISNYRRLIHTIIPDIQTYYLDYEMQQELNKETEFNIKLKYYGKN